MNFTKSLPDNEKYPVYAYEWKAWEGYLFPSICSEAIRIEAKIRQSNTDIIKKITGNHGYFLFHLNLTKTDFFFKNKEELSSRLKSKGITPLNAEINDISKQHLQGVCKQAGLNVTSASFDGDENELLITKTNFNHGGKPEKRLQRSEFRRLNLSSHEYNSDIIYPVMERKKIKSDVWKNDNLVVEKYIANEQNYFFRAYKLLNKVVISEVINPEIIKKMTTGIERTNYYFDLNNNILPGDNEKFIHLIEDIKDLSDAFKLDFGAIDIVKSDDNKYYIIDVNTTPNWQVNDQLEILNFLASGLGNTEINNVIKSV